MMGMATCTLCAIHITWQQCCNRIICGAVAGLPSIETLMVVIVLVRADLFCQAEDIQCQGRMLFNTFVY